MDSTVAFMLGIIIGEIITYFVWYKDPRSKLKYTIDISLKESNESIKDFIKRAHKERLGSYIIID